MNGARKNVKCAVAYMTGDNKGIHEVAGYFAAFYRTNRICRFCHATSASIQNQFQESEFDMRTEEEYDREVNRLAENGYPDDMRRTYGIRSEFRSGSWFILFVFAVKAPPPPQTTSDMGQTF